MDTKKCYTCQIEKPITEYWSNNRLRDGYYNHCKDCMKSKTAEQQDRGLDAHDGLATQVVNVIEETKAILTRIGYDLDSELSVSEQFDIRMTARYGKDYERCLKRK